MKQATLILLWTMLTVAISTLFNSWYFFLGFGITALIYCIKYERSEEYQ
jgi:hypothetical protein